jgi:hypothetical protein
MKSEAGKSGPNSCECGMIIARNQGLTDEPSIVGSIE